MDNTDHQNSIVLHGDEEIIEVIELNDTEPGPDDLADDLEDVDFDEDNDGDAEDNDGWETDDEMEAEVEQDDSELTFSKHTGSVFCVALDPATNSLVVTGGEDDKAYVWRLSDGEVLFECTGHKDSVTCVCFSHDSALVASGDISGLIKVWQVDSHEEVWSFEVSSDLECLEWHPRAPVLLAGTDDGNMWMWKVPGGECKTFPSPARNANGKILPDGKRAVVGYEDGSVRVWDLKQGNALHVVKGRGGHQGAVTCLASNKDGSLVVTGSMDGSAKLINTATGKMVCVFSVDGLQGKEVTNSVESVGFCNILPLVGVAYLDGTLAIFDLASQVLRHRCQHEIGIVRMQWEESSSLVSTCGLDGALRQWDGRSGNLVSEYRGHSNDVLDFALNRDASMAVTVSGDKRAKVFCLQRPDR